MGVPKFFRWISERYPCLSEVLEAHNIPEFDCFYLDMNGIIHNCSHPDENSLLHRMTDEEIFANIFHYIDILFRMVRPKEVFMLAVDGVAPRAKLNQQRSRRFRSAQEMSNNIKKALASGEQAPEEESFDSNCITPGTIFMINLQAQLEYFVTSKVSKDPLWQGVKVILSGHQVPGEGEHKIMDYIRFQQSCESDYKPFKRHCLYGLDADLIMLGLATHEPYIALLRQEVKFGRPQAKDGKLNRPEDLQFQLLHISLLREYLGHEFSVLATTMVKVKFDLQSIIDDWILLTFLIGNDFLPNLPTLHTDKGALSELMSIYKDVMPTLDGYINEAGRLNKPRFQVLLQSVAEKIERSEYGAIYSDLKWIEGKTVRRVKRSAHNAIEADINDHNDDTFGVEALDFGRNEDLDFGVDPSSDPDLTRLIQSADAYLDSDESDETDVSQDGSGVSLSSSNYFSDQFDSSVNETTSGPDNAETGQEVGKKTSKDDPVRKFESEFKRHRRHYYTEKMKYVTFGDDQRVDQVKAYVSGIQWVLYYYYEGCKSWSWYYPFHYAPWIADIVPDRDSQDVKDATVKTYVANVEVAFSLDAPFKPYEQLLSVLPPYSFKLIPKPYQTLMKNSGSPIRDFFPERFECDLNGKKHPWEAVVLIPFIDEVRLIRAMEAVDCSDMLEFERYANAEGQILVYTFSAKNSGPFHSPNGMFPMVAENRTDVERLDRSRWERSSASEDHSAVRIRMDETQAKFLAGEPGKRHYHNFPSLFDIAHSGKLVEDVKVRVFNSVMARSNEHLMLKVENLCTCSKCDSQNERSPALGPSMGRLMAMRHGFHGGPIAMAANLFGRHVWVDWPYQKEAQVVRILTPEAIFAPKNVDLLDRCGEDDVVTDRDVDIHVLPPKSNEHDALEALCRSVSSKYHSRRGIVLGPIEVLLEVRLVSGRIWKIDNNAAQAGALKESKQYLAGNVRLYPMQAVALSLNLVDPPGKIRNKSIADVFAIHEPVWSLANEEASADGSCVLDELVSYGSKGKVMSILSGKSGQIQVEFEVNTILPYLYLRNIKADYLRSADSYLTAKQAMRFVGQTSLHMSPQLISRLTGHILVDRTNDGDNKRWGQKKGMTNIGLRLKSNKNGTQVKGYSRRQTINDGRQIWTYSDRTLECIAEYVERFPRIAKLVSDSLDSNIDEKEIGSAELEAVVGWLKGQPCCEDTSLVEACDSPPAIEPDLIHRLRRTLNSWSNRVVFAKRIVTMPAQQLYSHRQNLCDNKLRATILADSRADVAFTMFDVVSSVDERRELKLDIGIVVGFESDSVDLDHQIVSQATSNSKPNSTNRDRLPVKRQINPYTTINVLFVGSDRPETVTASTLLNLSQNGLAVERCSTSTPPPHSVGAKSGEQNKVASNAKFRRNISRQNGGSPSNISHVASSTMSCTDVMYRADEAACRARPNAKFVKDVKSGKGKTSPKREFLAKNDFPPPPTVLSSDQLTSEWPSTLPVPPEATELPKPPTTFMMTDNDDNDGDDDQAKIADSFAIEQLLKKSLQLSN